MAYVPRENYGVQPGDEDYTPKQYKKDSKEWDKHQKKGGIPAYIANIDTPSFDDWKGADGDPRVEKIKNNWDKTWKKLPRYKQRQFVRAAREQDARTK
jgi:hypothetical protein